MNLLISCDCKCCRRGGCDFIVTPAMASKSCFAALSCICVCG